MLGEICWKKEICWRKEIFVGGRRDMLEEGEIC